MLTKGSLIWPVKRKVANVRKKSRQEVFMLMLKKFAITDLLHTEVYEEVTMAAGSG
jgi:hypothetical protein